MREAGFHPLAGLRREFTANLDQDRRQRRERDFAARSVANSVNSAPGPDDVAHTVVEAALGPWRMRRTPPGQASLLSKLRRFLPAGPVDASLRKALGLA
jgi:hypothetical protein